MSNIRKVAITALIGTSLLAGAVSVSAQQAAPTPALPPSQGDAMDHHGMMQGGGMMPMMGQMSRTIENCNRMMQSHMDRQNPGSGQQPQGNRG